LEPLTTASSHSWEAEIDSLIEEQMSANLRQRKKLYDRAQEILAENRPCFLAECAHSTGAKNSIGNFHPAFWNPTYYDVEQLYLKNAENAAR